MPHRAYPQVSVHIGKGNGDGDSKRALEHVCARARRVHANAMSEVIYYDSRGER
jgi:hypothetical protein